MAVQALTVSRTSHSAVVALAVLLDAVGFLARASLDRHKSFHAFEVAGMSVVGHHFGGLDVPLIPQLVEAPDA